MDELSKMTPPQRAEFQEREVFAELTANIESATDLCLKFGSKTYLRRLISYKTDAARFSDIFERLDAAIQDLQLGIALDQHGWIAVQTKDTAAAVHVLEEIRLGQGKVLDGQDEIKEMIAKLAAAARGSGESGGAVGGSDAPREVWELYSKELSFDKDEDEERIQLGSGNFGAVYLGTFRGIKVAIKRIKYVGDAGRALVRGEIDILVKLHHPHIVAFHGASVHKYGDLVLELLKCTLTEAMYKQSEKVVLDQPTKLRLAIEIASGMAYLHASHVRRHLLNLASCVWNSFESYLYRTCFLMVPAIDY
jgi:hypothetical protein